MEIKKTEMAGSGQTLKMTGENSKKKEKKEDKSILARAKDWFSKQTGNEEGGDYGVKLTAAGLTAAGAGTGGYLAHKSAANDTVVMHYRTEEMLKVDAKPPDPGRVFNRTEIKIIGDYLKNSGIPKSGNQRIMQYLAYLSETRPDQNVAGWGQIFDQVQAHSASQADMFKTLQVVGAVLEKNQGMSPQQAYMEFRSVQNQTPASGDAIQAYIDKFSLGEFDYMDKIIQIVPKHTSPFWRLGRAGAATVGALGGALVGAGIGAMVMMIHKVITR